MGGSGESGIVSVERVNDIHVIPQWGCATSTATRSLLHVPSSAPSTAGWSRSSGMCPVSSGCTARGWGAAGGGVGVLRVGGAFVQYAQPVVSGSRPSWSRPTRADSGRSRRRTMVSGPLRRRRSGSGAGGPVTEALGCATKNPGLTPVRPGVHSADMNEPAVEAPSGDRWNAAVLLRCAAPMQG